MLCVGGGFGWVLLGERARTPRSRREDMICAPFFGETAAAAAVLEGVECVAVEKVLRRAEHDAEVPRGCQPQSVLV